MDGFVACSVSPSVGKQRIPEYLKASGEGSFTAVQLLLIFMGGFCIALVLMQSIWFNLVLARAGPGNLGPVMVLVASLRFSSAPTLGLVCHSPLAASLLHFFGMVE